MEPIKIHGTTNGRWYKFPNGEFVPSVTTVTSGGCPTPHYLLKWIIKEADGDYEKFKQQSGEAARNGTLVHKLIEEGLVGGRMEIENPNISVQRALVSFSGWWNTSDLRVVELETFLWSDELKDGKLRFPFCGTADGILRDSNDKLVLVDWKTSKQVDSKMGLQLSAYKMLWDATHDEKIDRLLVVHCKKDFKGQTPAKSFKAEHWMDFAPYKFANALEMFTELESNFRGKLEPSIKHIYPNEFTLEVRNA